MSLPVYTEPNPSVLSTDCAAEEIAVNIATTGDKSNILFVVFKVLYYVFMFSNLCNFWSKFWETN